MKSFVKDRLEKWCSLTREKHKFDKQTSFWVSKYLWNYFEQKNSKLNSELWNFKTHTLQKDKKKRKLWFETKKNGLQKVKITKMWKNGKCLPKKIQQNQGKMTFCYLRCGALKESIRDFSFRSKSRRPQPIQCTPSSCNMVCSFNWFLARSNSSSEMLRDTRINSRIA